MKRPFLTVFFFVGLGAALLSINLGLINLGETSWKSFIVPGIFIVLGAGTLDSYTKKQRNGMGVNLVWGLFAFVYGMLLTFDVLDLFDFSYGDWLKLWPILLVAFGLHQLFKEPEKEQDKMKAYDGYGKKSKNKSHKVYDKKSYHTFEWELEPMQINKKVAEYYFDFSKAIIPLGETPIHLTGYVGDVHMLIPEHLAVHITVKGNVGDVELFDQIDDGLHTNLVYVSPNFEEADKRLRIYIEYNVVDVKIQAV